MKAEFFAFGLLLLVPAMLYSQTGSINNTLGTGGSFTIKDGSTTFFSLTQSDGKVSLNKTLTLPVTTGSSVGVIFKGGDRFIHDYQASGTAGYNTFLGVNAGNFTMSGSGALASFNTAVGYYSLTSLTSGESNAAFGSISLASNTTGKYNSAFGTYSLFGNTTGSYNSAVGINSLYSNTTGSYNSAVGVQSLLSNTTGSENTAVGYQSLYSNTTNSGNTAVGWNSLYANTGYQNTAVGHHSLNSNTLGNYNTALGYNAGSTITEGFNLTCIGIDAAPSAVDAANQVTLGNSFVTSLRCAVITITALSDARDKKNIKDLSLGLDFLMSVKARLFNWDRREWYTDGKSDGSKMQEKPTAGFIAQEMDEAQKSADAEWLNLVLKDNPDKLEATPGNLLPIMVKAIQELKAENDALKNEVVTLRASIAEQVRNEVKAVMLKAFQQDATTKVSLNETKN